MIRKFLLPSLMLLALPLISISIYAQDYANESVHPDSPHGPGGPGGPGHHDPGHGPGGWPGGPGSPGGNHHPGGGGFFPWNPFPWNPFPLYPFNPFPGTNYTSNYNVQCGSINFGYNECYLPTPGNDIFLVTQLSNYQCIKGFTFGINYSRMWVSDGCRGIFKIIATY